MKDNRTGQPDKIIKQNEKTIQLSVFGHLNIMLEEKVRDGEERKSLTQEGSREKGLKIE